MHFSAIWGVVILVLGSHEAELVPHSFPLSAAGRVGWTWPGIRPRDCQQGCVYTFLFSSERRVYAFVYSVSDFSTCYFGVIHVFLGTKSYVLFDQSHCGGALIGPMGRRSLGAAQEKKGSSPWFIHLGYY